MQISWSILQVENIKLQMWRPVFRSAATFYISVVRQSVAALTMRRFRCVSLPASLIELLKLPVRLAICILRLQRYNYQFIAYFVI